MLLDFEWTPELLESLVGGRWVNARDFRARRVATSSKKPVKNALFISYTDATFRRYMGDCNFVRFAREGRKFGNLRAARRAAAQGWTEAAIVEKELGAPVPQLVVDDAFAALETLAKHKRSLLRSKVVAVTGTVGKSSTLKALDAVLGERSERLSKFNVRNALAVGMANAPLSDENSYLVAEVSVSALWGEDAGVSQLLRPDVAVLTEIGLGMTHRVPSIRGTAEVKANLISGMSQDGVLLYNAEMKYADYVRERAQRQPVITRSYGFQHDTDYRVLDTGAAEGPDGSLWQTGEITGPSEDTTISIPAFGKAHLYATTAAVAVADALGENVCEAAKRASGYRPSGTAERIRRMPDERLGVEHLIVDGTFSATPLSMRHSFDLAAQMHTQSDRERTELIGVVGRIVALGDQAEEAHRDLVEPLVAAGFDRIYTYGPDLGALAEELSLRAIHAGHFESTESLAAHLAESLTGSSTILLKGSKRASDFRDVRKHLARCFGAETRAVAVRVTGKVQGVGYRKWAKAQAVESGLLGWVRNAGTDVEIRVQGPSVAIQHFLEACEQGPTQARVTDVIHREVGAAKFKQFRIRKTLRAESAKPGREFEQQAGNNGPVGYEPAVVTQGFGSQKLSAYTVALESWRRGLTVTFRDPQGIKYTVSDGTQSISFYGSRSSLTTREANRTVENKHLTLKRLREAGVPVPKSRLVHASQTSIDELVEIAEREYRWPVVIKPVDGSRGDGVFVNISSAQELRDLYLHLTSDLGAGRILLEEHVQGDDYRIYVVGEKVVGAARRIPANIQGDGSSTVRQLIKAKNALRKQHPFFSKGLIRRDVEIDNMLDWQGLNYDSVPPAGCYVQLRQKANASAGGDVEDITDQLPQAVSEAAVTAVSSIEGLLAAAVDVLWESTRDTVSNSFAIIELNARAHIGVNMYPTRGRGPNIPAAIVDHFFPGSNPPQKTGFHALAFNLDSVLEPLRAGTAAQVQVAPLPEHGYPVRWVIELPGRIELSEEQRRRVRLASRKYGVAGSLERRAEVSRLIVGGEGLPLSDFLTRLAGILGQDLPEPGVWHGTIMPGFYVTDAGLLKG